LLQGVKIPCFHPTTWAIDIIDSNKLEPKDASVILCGAWAVGRKGMRGSMENV
jgi:hypothetical protein